MLLVMNGSDGSDESMHQGETADADLPDPNVELTLEGVYNIFRDCMRTLLSDPVLEISYTKSPMGPSECIVIGRRNDVLKRICMNDGCEILEIRLFGYYDLGAPTLPCLASIQFTLNDSKRRPVIEGNKSMLISKLKRLIKSTAVKSEETGAESSEIKRPVHKSEETSAKSSEDDLIKTLNEIIRMCNEAISKHGRG
jgi:hypothetical protein